MSRAYRVMRARQVVQQVSAPKEEAVITAESQVGSVVGSDSVDVSVSVDSGSEIIEEENDTFKGRRFNKLNQKNKKNIGD